MKKTHFRLALKDGSVSRIAAHRVRNIAPGADELRFTVHGASRTVQRAQLESLSLWEDSTPVATFSLDRSSDERAQLSIEECQDIVVDSTPKGQGSFTGPEQQLMALGVVNASTQTVFRAGVMVRVAARGFSIASNKIESAPQDTVATSRDSVFRHAK